MEIFFYSNYQNTQIYGVSMTVKFQESQLCFGYMSKDPSTKHIPQTTIRIPNYNTETINTPYWGTVGPYGKCRAIEMRDTYQTTYLMCLRSSVWASAPWLRTWRLSLG